MAGPATLFDKIWSSHAILVRPDGATLLHIDRHLVHDGSGNAFRMLKEKGLAVRRPDRTFATPDHYVSTLSHDLASINEPHRRGVVEDLEANAKAAGLTLFGLSDRRQGIEHRDGPGFVAVAFVAIDRHKQPAPVLIGHPRSIHRANVIFSSSVRGGTLFPGGAPLAVPEIKFIVSGCRQTIPAGHPLNPLIETRPSRLFI